MKRQCLLRKTSTQEEIVSWVDERIAKKAFLFEASIELREDNKSLGFYKVLEIYEPPLSDEYLSKKRAADKDFKRKTDY